MSFLFTRGKGYDITVFKLSTFCAVSFVDRRELIKVNKEFF